MLIDKSKTHTCFNFKIIGLLKVGKIIGVVVGGGFPKMSAWVWQASPLAPPGEFYIPYPHLLPC
jgi:hypothetical protein